MDTEYLAGLKDFYLRQLTEDILPFWLRHGRDTKCGGYHTCLDRDGSVYDYGKLCMWSQGRVVWTFSHLYNELEPNPEWLDMARWGVEFILEHGFAPDGSMYYELTREGLPLRPAQDIYTELSTVLGFTEYARATRDEGLYERARDLFMSVWERLRAPGQAFQPCDATTIPVRLHGHSMITLNVIQELRRFREEPAYPTLVDQCLRVMTQLHLKPERRALFELVRWNGELLPGGRGRWINPGHMIEGGIFLIHEGRYRDDARLIRTGVDLIAWGFERGWDKEFGGLFNDVDVEGKPVPDADALIYPTKLWWQHAEALYGLLLAYVTTEDEKFLDAYRRTHDFSFGRLADPEYGEWIVGLHPCGRPISMAKGNARKSLFHLGRNLFCCHDLLRRL